VDRVIHLFALLFGAGILGLLPFLSHRRIRPGFFMLVSTLGFLAVLFSLRSAANPFLVALLAVALIYGILLLTRRTERAQTVAWFFLAAALGAVSLGGWSFASGSMGSGQTGAGAAPFTAAAFIAGAGLLGSMTLALLLGHWYLYSPGLPVSHLRRLTTLVAAFLAARLLVFSAGVPAFAQEAWGSGTASAQPNLGFDAAALLASNIPLVAMRFALGILIPAILAWMIDRTVRIRSTQAATGLLYVSFIFVLFGEFIAAYLCVLTGVPV
jgi:hypothetical protein